MNPRDTLTLEEVAKLIGSAPEKIIPLLESGEIPAKLVDGQWLVSKTGLEGWRLNSAGLGSVLRVWGTSVPAAVQLSLEEAAKVLNLPQDKLEELAKRGMVAGFKQQGKWVFPKGAVDTYLAKNKPPGAQAPQGWQSKKSGGGSLQASSEASGWPASSKIALPSPRLVNEPVTTTPASLELDLSILDKLEIPEGPMDEEYEDEDDDDTGESDENE